MGLERLGRFRIERELGAGGMGIVYLARDERLRRTVALKVLPPDKTHDEHRRRRFLREARALGAVTHPNVAAVYDVDEIDGRIVIAMEYVIGTTLRARLAHGPPSIDEALRLIRDIAAGLAAVHAAGIVHRDLKPENVMIDRDGRTKVLDFGIARRDARVAPLALTVSASDISQDVGPDGTATTAQGQVIGTPGYMAPEQALGMEVDIRADVFAFGVLMYELLTGAPPFDGPSLADITVATVRLEPPAPSARNAAVHAELDQLVMRCLRKEPDARPADAGAVLEALAAFAPAAPPSGAPRSVSASIPKRFPRSRWLLVTALALGAALGAWRWRRSNDAPAASGSARSDAPPAPTPITSLDPPRTRSAEALAAYQRGLQAMRDANWDSSATEFERAIELDPDFAAAHLRLAMAVQARPGLAAKARAAFDTAEKSRAALGPRDQALLFALEPYLARDPVVVAAALERLEQARAAHPGDAELTVWIAFLCYGQDPERALRESEAALAIDPAYGDAWQFKARALEVLGDHRGAVAALDACIARVPAADDCRKERMDAYADDGECRPLLELARNTTLRGYHHDWHAAALTAVGGAANLAASEEVIRRGASSDPGWRGSQARLELVNGRFRAALAHAEAELERAMEGGDRAAAGTAARLVAEIRLESGELAAAADVAAAFAARQEGMVRAPGWGRRHDQRLWMSALLHHAGRIDAERLELTRREWVDGWRELGRHDSFDWLYAHVDTAFSAEQARAALAARPARSNTGGWNALDRTKLGKLELLAGRAVEAIPHLEAGVRSCRLFFAPLDHFHARAWLAQAYEAAHRDADACAQYRAIRDAWSAADPRSLTAEDAARRSRTLGCR